MKDTKEPDMRRQQLKEKGRFTPAALSELREIGVDAFAEKYGYRKQAKSVIVRAWERLTGTKTTREKASSAPHMDGKLPPLIAEAIKLLPPAGTPLPLERKNLLRQLIDCSIELSYGGK